MPARRTRLNSEGNDRDGVEQERVEGRAGGLDPAPGHRRPRWKTVGHGVLLSLAVLLQPSPASADFAHAASWFERLSENERLSLHVALAFTGYYGGEADSEFDPGLFDAVTQFQRDQVFQPTGALAPAQRELLDEEAANALRFMGFESLDDPETGVSLAIPTAFFDQSVPTEGGTIWVSSRFAADLETIAIPTADVSFEERYAQLSASTAGRTVTYRLMATSFFIVAGRVDGRRFYSRLQWTPTASVGFEFTWTPQLTAFQRLAILMSNSLAVRPVAAPAPASLEAGQPVALGSGQGSGPGLSNGIGEFPLIHP